MITVIPDLLINFIYFSKLDVLVHLSAFQHYQHVILAKNLRFVRLCSRVFYLGELALLANVVNIFIGFYVHHSLNQLPIPGGTLLTILS